MVFQFLEPISFRDNFTETLHAVLADLVANLGLGSSFLCYVGYQYESKSLGIVFQSETIVPPKSSLENLSLEIQNHNSIGLH